MRCILVKEKTDASCDGGSEHTEALATAIDALLHHYLVNMMEEANEGGFEGTIRIKAALLSAPLLEDRGFRAVTELQTDMVTCPLYPVLARAQGPASAPLPFARNWVESTGRPTWSVLDNGNTRFY